MLAQRQPWWRQRALLTAAWKKQIASAGFPPANQKLENKASKMPVVVFFPGSSVVQGGSSLLQRDCLGRPLCCTSLPKAKPLGVNGKSSLHTRCRSMQAAHLAPHSSHIYIKLFLGILRLPNTLFQQNKDFQHILPRGLKFTFPQGLFFLVPGEAAIHYVWVGKHRLAIAVAPQIFNDVQSLQEAFLDYFFLLIFKDWTSICPLFNLSPLVSAFSFFSDFQISVYICGK